MKEGIPMRRFFSLLLVLALMFTSFAFAEEESASPRRGRGDVEIVNEEIEGEFEGEDNGIVLDPDEELLLDEVTIVNAFETLDNVRNILLIGLDSRSSAVTGRSDTMMLLTVDIEKKTIKLTSFLRDTYVEIPGQKNNRLNSAYVFGGYDLLAKTLYKNFGVKPDAYVAINLSGLVNVIDQLGGVYVDVPSNKIDRVNAVIYWYNQQVLDLKNTRDGFLTKGGYQKLTGKQAEAWARYRYSESDFQRSARQRQLIQMIFDKITEMSVAELGTFAMKNVSLVKTNLSIGDIISLAPAVLALKDAEIQELQIPLSNAYHSETISGMSVLVPNRQKNVDALREFLKK